MGVMGSGAAPRERRGSGSIEKLATTTRQRTTMNKTIETETTQPKKLEKPVREAAEMKREELVTYANEAGGGGGATTTAGFFTTTGPGGYGGPV